MSADITRKRLKNGEWTLTARITGLTKEVADALALELYNSAPGPKISVGRVATPAEDRLAAKAGKEKL